MEQNTRKIKRSVFADKISEITGWTHEEALSELRYADSLGIKRSLYFKLRGYEWTHQELEALAYEFSQKDSRSEDSREDYVETIMNDTGCSREEAAENLARRTRYKLKKRIFVPNGCHLMNDAELEAFVETRDKRVKMAEEVTAVDALDKGSPEITELYKLALPARKNRINETISFFKGDIEDSYRLRIASEMDYLNLKYGFFMKEYFLYGLENKSTEETESFIANASRKKYLRKLNTPRGFIICRNKATSYEHLSPLYKREIIEVNGENDFEKTADFIRRHPDFVFKPIDSSFGEGISHIRADSGYDAGRIAADLIKKDPFILEETIIADERIRALHPASINTIRVTTYIDDNGNVKIHLPFFKIGQKGSFIDNGGSGGIFALIDASTGTVISNGKDESNKVYANHPDTGIPMKGFRVPEWESLVCFAEKAARMFPDVRYAGWDMALSADRGWLVVEVNCRTQFYGQQMCDEIGKKHDLEDLINWNRLKQEDEFAEIWRTIDRY